MIKYQLWAEFKQFCENQKKIKNVFLVRSSSVRQIRPNTERLAAKPTFQTNTVSHYNKFKKKVDKKYLEVGQNVMCIHNKEMATVRYIGHADFAPGIWIGLELKKQLGESLSLSLSLCLIVCLKC